MPSNIPDVEAETRQRVTANGGLSDPSTWVAIYVVAALVLLIMLRLGFRPVIPR